MAAIVAVPSAAAGSSSGGSGGYSRAFANKTKRQPEPAPVNFELLADVNRQLTGNQFNLIKVFDLPTVHQFKRALGLL